MPYIISILIGGIISILLTQNKEKNDVGQKHDENGVSCVGDVCDSKPSTSTKKSGRRGIKYDGKGEKINGKIIHKKHVDERGNRAGNNVSGKSNTSTETVDTPEGLKDEQNIDEKSDGNDGDNVSGESGKSVVTDDS